MSENTTNRIRVVLADKRIQRFRRCGINFKAQEPTILSAPPLSPEQIQRLKDEPMLKVTDLAAGDASEPSNQSANDPGLSLLEAIDQLNLDDKSLWLKSSGAPSTEALEAIVGHPVSAAERDQAWSDYQSQTADKGAEA